MEGIPVFICNIFGGLSGQLCSPAALANGKYSPLGLAVERQIRGSTDAVWKLCGRDKYLVPARNCTKIPQTSYRVLITILGVSRLTWATVCEES